MGNLSEIAKIKDSQLTQREIKKAEREKKQLEAAKQKMAAEIAAKKAEAIATVKARDEAIKAKKLADAKELEKVKKALEAKKKAMQAKSKEIADAKRLLSEIESSANIEFENNVESVFKARLEKDKTYSAKDLATIKRNLVLGLKNRYNIEKNLDVYELEYLKRNIKSSHFSTKISVSINGIRHIALQDGKACILFTAGLKSPYKKACSPLALLRAGSFENFITQSFKSLAPSIIDDTELIKDFDKKVSQTLAKNANDLAANMDFLLDTYTTAKHDMRASNKAFGIIKKSDFKAVYQAETSKDKASKIFEPVA